jgi:hypothetical protein
MPVKSILSYPLLFVASGLLANAAETDASLEQRPTDAPRVRDNAFPACVQFSPMPSGSEKGWKGEKPPLTEDVQRETIQNIIAHGFSVLYYPLAGFSEEHSQSVLRVAQSRGMKVNYMTGGFEMFDRDHPPAISVYSPRYVEEVRKRVQAGLAPMKGIERNNHEAAEPQTTVRLGDLFLPGQDDRGDGGGQGHLQDRAQCARLISRTGR